MIKCPHCGRELDTVEFIEEGIRVWDDKIEEWVDDFRFSNAVFRCPSCRSQLDFNFLQSEGVV